MTGTVVRSHSNRVHTTWRIAATGLRLDATNLGKISYNADTFEQKNQKNIGKDNQGMPAAAPFTFLSSFSTFKSPGWYRKYFSENV